MLKFFRAAGVRHAIMAGQIAPRNLFDLHPDWKALLLLARLKQRNAESIFGGIALELEKVGVELLSATTFLEDMVASRDLIAGPKLTRRQLNDIDFGWNVAKEIARNVLPVAIYTQFYWTVNARSLMNFVSLRNSETAQREIQRYAGAVEQFFAEKMPVTHAAFVENGRRAP